jgi:hypothetical protein
MNFQHKNIYPERSKDTAFRIINDEAVIMNLTTGDYYSINEVGARIWDLCDGGHSIRDIALFISQEFDAAEETAGQDVMELLNDLSGEKLIIIRENPRQAT